MVPSISMIQRVIFSLGHPPWLARGSERHSRPIFKFLFQCLFRPGKLNSQFIVTTFPVLHTGGRSVFRFQTQLSSRVHKWNYLVLPEKCSVLFLRIRIPVSLLRTWHTHHSKLSYNPLLSHTLTRPRLSRPAPNLIKSATKPHNYTAPSTVRARTVRCPGL